jgi:5-methyltetrahydrofolate corrinoid/iron sulfur protein methyltransferase
MYIIGEKINGMFKNVREAIGSKNKDVIKELAKKQIDSGAHALDVNVGPASANPMEDMQWLIKTVREVTDAPLAVDTTKPDVMDAGLSLAGAGSFLNSITGEEEKLNKFLPIASKHNTRIVALTIDKSGIPAHAEGRLEIAANIIAKAIENGIDTGNLYIDLVILPGNVSHPHSSAVLEAMKQVKILCDPAPKSILGLSNVSQGTVCRNLVDRTYLGMALACGLDAAILNPMDKELMDTMITSELLLGKNIYCDSFLDAYRKK